MKTTSYRFQQINNEVTPIMSESRNYLSSVLCFCLEKRKSANDSGKEQSQVEWDDSETEEESICDSEDDCMYDCNEKKDARCMVQFGCVRIREHDLVVGDHFGSKEYPISFDWSHSECEAVVDLEKYEEERETRRKVVESSGNNMRPCRINDAAARFERICLSTNLSHDAIIALEKERFDRYRKNCQRSAIGLPIL